MTQIARTTIRPATPAPVHYFPEVHSGFDGELYFPELGVGDTTFATIVADIASAQHEDIVRVIAVDLANGRSWDASKEIAKEVLHQVIADPGEASRLCGGA
jgi:hypothetical protein